MGISEKQVPKYLSYAAIAGSVIVCGAIWVAGSSNPRGYTSDMAYGRHSTYGSSVECYKCHVPEGSKLGMSTSLTCLTSGCHGELSKSLPHAEAVALYKTQEVVQETPEVIRDKVAEAHITNHVQSNFWTCQYCHKEHKKEPAAKPKYWVSISGARHSY